MRKMYKKALIAVMTIGLVLLSLGLSAQKRELFVEKDGVIWYKVTEKTKDGKTVCSAVNDVGKVIILRSEGLTDIKYDTKQGGYFKVYKDRKEGIYSKTGRKIVEPLYYSAEYNNYFGFIYCIVNNKGKKGVCNSNGELIIPVKFDLLYYSEIDGYFVTIISKNGKSKHGAYSKEGKKLFSPKYESLFYSNDVFVYKTKSGKYVDTKTTLLDVDPSKAVYVDESGMELHSFSDGFKYYAITKDGFPAVLSTKGDTLIPASRQYNKIEYQKGNGGWFLVKKDGKTGMCDPTGKELLKPDKYDKIAYYYDGFDNQIIKVCLNNLWGVCDGNGNLMISPKYDAVSYNEHYNYFSVKKDNKEGACTIEGIEIIPPQYESLTYDSDGVFKYKNKQSDKWISTGKTLDDKEITLQTEKDGFQWYLVESDGKYAAQDKSGDYIITLYREYTNIEYLISRNNNGWFKVTKDNKKGVCDKSGNIIIYPRKYDNIYYLDDHYTVYVGDMEGVCDIKGYEIVPPKYDHHIITYYEGFWYVESTTTGVTCLYDKKGNLIIRDRDNYDNVVVMNDGMIWCSKNDGDIKATYTKSGDYVGAGWISKNEIDQQNAQRQAEYQARRAEQLNNIANAFNAAAAATSTYTSSSTNTYSSTSTSKPANTDRLVGRIQAFGLSQAFGNTVTHSQVFEVYQDSKGYYINDPKYRGVKKYLQRNTQSTMYEYSVSQYNYWTLTTLGSDIFWYFKL